MTQLTLLERKRKALVHAKLDSLQIKFGTHTEIIKVGKINYRLDLGEEILTQALIKFFEDELDNNPHKPHALINTYNCFITKNGNLTSKGEDFMTHLLEYVAQKTEPIK
ncbi:hypothetical protein [Xenorhabdus hominickii]|uniref:Uncharacterized protein n=1 Tax=Xenorhabdus hominickii TaxID=351679 RepID=A0A2G0Q3I6_XENHO|nr:hypothetical protein [Xenorhabdus hominickii]AOM39993.1 hypothetical protein A9255_05035 [Xenorhabdus hominickii]PHM52034.1 hypothetical protein Xhom_04683 [Xenorhabdus hominickii]PHM52994.1 hypothetical protein Xhom_03876 [Xenorhabdus hominickii]PHM53788.1 hypothetical protein Xhom_03789 [Xenorhabdus hominickii]